MKTDKITLFLIFLFFFSFFIFRFAPDELPPTPQRDEVSVAYNAWSVAQTGKDEHNIPYPSSFLAFGDQKIPFYTYFVAGLYKFLPISISTARLPSAFFGALSVIALYLLVLTLTANKKTALISSVVFALAPWHIVYSRMVYEANVELFFLLTTILLLITGLKKKRGFLIILSLIFINLGFYTYNSTVFLLPLIIGLIFWLWRKNLNKKTFFVFFILLVFSYLSYFKVFAKGNEARSKATILDMDRITKNVLSARYETADADLPFSRLFHNKFVFLLTNGVRNYTYTVFHPDFLYFFGDNNPWHKTYGIGHGNLYLIELPFFIAGIYFLLKKKTKESKLLLAIVFVSPLAASLTWDTPVTTRLALYLTLHSAVAVAGFIFVFDLIKNTQVKLIAGISSLVLFLYFFVWFLFDYAYLFPKNLHSIWNEGLPEAIVAVSKLKEQNNYDRIFVYAEGDWEFSYIYFAWYTPFLPSSLTENAKWDQEIFQRVKFFENYYFFHPSENEEVKQSIKPGGRYLYIMPSDKSIGNTILLQKIKSAKGLDLINIRQSE